jgi:hypothetical protein
MTEKRRKQIVYAVFVVAVIWGAFNLMGRRRIVETVPPESEPSVTVAAVTPDLQRQKPATVEPQWGRDPFARGGTSIAAIPDEYEPALRLAAISITGGKAIAMIDGKMLSVGDQVNGWRVAAISKSGVRLESHGRQITLKIGG